MRSKPSSGMRRAWKRVATATSCSRRFSSNPTRSGTRFAHTSTRNVAASTSMGSVFRKMSWHGSGGSTWWPAGRPGTRAWSAKFVLEELTGLPTEVDYASEYRYRTPLVGDDVLVIGVTQSGETADTLAAMEMAREAGALLATVCNVRGSSAWRLAPSQILTQAGPEIGVASTKAFTTQLVAMVLIALGLRLARGLAGRDRCRARNRLAETAAGCRAGAGHR